MNGFRLKLLIMKKNEYERILKDLNDIVSDICGGTIQEWITHSHKDSFEGKMYKFYKPFHEQLYIDVEKDSYKTVWERYPLISEFWDEVRNLSDDDIVLYRYSFVSGTYVTDQSDTSLEEIELGVVGNILFPWDPPESISLVLFNGKVEDQWEEIMEDTVEEIEYGFYIVEENKVRDLLE